MCLGIPGRIVEMVDEGQHLARVDVSGVKRVISLALVHEEAVVGSWVLVHVGFALSVLDEADAAETLRLLEAMGDAMDEELARMQESGEA
jgi:hydrogenase expression/formation protein HypC